MTGPKWFSWAKIIDPTRKTPPWWKRNNTALVVAVASLLSAGANWWYTWVTRQSLIAEHRPVLEIVEAMKGDTTIHLKNSGRSAALTIRNELWCDLGKLTADSNGFAFRSEFSIPIGSMQSLDVPTGGTLQTSTFIPWKGLFKDFDAHYRDDSALRLRGTLHYQDERQNHYALPWCYETLHPKNDKPDFFPCWYMESKSYPWR